MELSVQVPWQNDVAGTLSANDKIFDREFNSGLIHQVVVSYQAAARQGTKQQKNRSDVRGGGKKPWRQKGTGRARAGTNCSPIWRTGGVTFAARPRDYSKKVNKKMYRAAMQSIFSELNRQGRLKVFETLTLDDHKTKTLAGKLKDMALNNVLIITDEFDTNLFLAARNLVNVEVQEASFVDPVSLVGYENIIISKAAVKQLEERLG